MRTVQRADRRCRRQRLGYRMQIQAISLDLDDTLWPITPIVLRAEQRLHDWLLQHCPAVAVEYPIAAMRMLRDRIAVENPHLAHDFTAQRKLSLTTALQPHGYGEDVVEAAFEAFFTARNEVELYTDALPALERLRCARAADQSVQRKRGTSAALACAICSSTA